MVTRPGVNRNSIALWVTSIQDGIASGRQSTKIGGGRPAFSSSNISAILAAALAFQGGGLVFTWASWSVTFGFQTPLQSGSLARSAQSCAVGGGLITTGFLAVSADCAAPAKAGRAASKTAPRRSLSRRSLIRPSFIFAATVKITPPAQSVQREADLTPERHHADPQCQRDDAGRLGAERRALGRAPARDVAAGKEMEDRHVEARK